MTTRPSSKNAVTRKSADNGVSSSQLDAPVIGVPDNLMELELHVPVRQSVLLHELDDAPRLDFAEDGTDIDSTFRPVQLIDAQGLAQVSFVADDELQDVSMRLAMSEDRLL